MNSEFIPEGGNNELPDIDTGFVKVSIRTVMEWSYQKGYLDRMLEEEKQKNEAEKRIEAEYEMLKAQGIMKKSTRKEEKKWYVYLQE